MNPMDASQIHAIFDMLFCVSRLSYSDLEDNVEVTFQTKRINFSVELQSVVSNLVQRSIQAGQFMNVYESLVALFQYEHFGGLAGLYHLIKFVAKMLPKRFGSVNCNADFVGQ
jgi:hypothetical protein